MESLDSTLYLSNDDLFLLASGKWYRSYEKLGAHPAVDDAGTSGYHFAVWAPDVKSVHVIGDFNGWDEQANPLSCSETGGVWQGFIPGIGQEALYKYLIETADGRKLYKADPYGFYAEQIPGTASRTFDLAGYDWADGAYMKARAKRDMFKEPLNIFEVHLGSWRRHGDEPQGEPRPDGTYPGPGDPFPAQRGVVYSYDDLSVELVAYAKDMGYSHIEIMPVNEHPFDGSWGYQPTGYYAATSRYGNPKQFMHFIDACHEAGIGVILDWVPGGFCADAQGLATFNGEMLYEHKIHPNWSTHQFDYSRGEVRSFLVSNALFWADLFHADGIRMDGVSSMLYMNFGIDDPGQKRFNEKGTEEDLDASAFIRQTNEVMGKFHPDVMMIAEESTAWPLVTYPPEDGGLGFHFKWDMGWMNDTLHYMQTDFPWRPGNYRMLTFSSMYQFNENFILPLSHDEVVNGKCSLITRMPGDYWRQFAGMRALAFYQVTHPRRQAQLHGQRDRAVHRVALLRGDPVLPRRAVRDAPPPAAVRPRPQPLLQRPRRALAVRLRLRGLRVDRRGQLRPVDHLVHPQGRQARRRARHPHQLRRQRARGLPHGRPGVGRLRGALQLRRRALRRLRRHQHRQAQVPGRAVERPRAVRRGARPAARWHDPQEDGHAASPGQEEARRRQARGQGHQGRGEDGREGRAEEARRKEARGQEGDVFRKDGVIEETRR